MKSERIRRRIEFSSSSEVSESSDCSKSNHSVSRKAISSDASTCSFGDPISADTSNEIDRYAEESPMARSDSQWSIDGDKIDERAEAAAMEYSLNGQKYPINRLLSCKRPETKRSSDDNDSAVFDRYDAEDTLRDFWGGGDGGTDEIITGRRSHPFPDKQTAVAHSGPKNHCESVGFGVDDSAKYSADSSAASSRQQMGQQIIAGRRSHPFPDKQAMAAAPMTAKGRKKRNPPKPQPVGFGVDDSANSSAAPSRRQREQQIITGRRSHQFPDKQAMAPMTVEGRKKRNTVKGGLSSSPPKPPRPVDDSAQYFADFSSASSRRLRAQQIKHVYAAPDVKARAARARRTAGRSHDASSFINRQTKGREIARTNKIIADKILNVRTTIPKSKR